MSVSRAEPPTDKMREKEPSEPLSPFEHIDEVAHGTSRKLLWLLAIGAFLLLLVHGTSIGQRIRDWDTLADLATTGGNRAPVYFLALSSFLILLGAPRLLFCALGGFAFGFWEGLLWSQVASLLGSYLAFRLARWGGREALSRRFGHHHLFARVMGAEPTVVAVAVVRMLPLSNVLINVGLALGRVSDRVFLAGSLLGFLPQGVVAVVVGSGIAEDMPWAGGVQIACASLLSLTVFPWTAKCHRRQRH